MSSQKETHLTFIQNAINRMASNSFFIKGWAIALCSAIIVVGKNIHLISLFSIVVLVALWIMDSFFLYTERLFRKLYEDVVGGSETTLFSMDINKYRKNYCPAKVFFSMTLWIFYTVLIVFMVLVYLFYK